MDILDIGPEFKAAIGRLRAFAEARVNWFYPMVQPIAGDNPAYVVNSGTLHIVFTWTVIEQHGASGVFRHLSVSTVVQSPDQPRFPSRTVTYTVANLLGFTGAHVSGDLVVAPADDWQLEISDAHAAIPHVMLVQRIPAAALIPSPTSN